MPRRIKVGEQELDEFIDIKERRCGRPVADKTGKRFGRLVAIKIVGKSDNGARIWLCKCDCGKEHYVESCRLNKNGTKSCGCLSKEKLIDRSRTHGMTKTRIFSIWDGMKKRCLLPTNGGYKNYGARGIKVCERWLEFQNFYDDMYESYLKHVEEFGEKNTSLDRIDVNGNYEPSNCRWATLEEQNNHRTNNRFIIYNGSKMTVTQVGRIVGKDFSGVMRNVRDGIYHDSSKTE